MEHKITVISFDKKLNSRSLPRFRGAIAALFPDDNKYHNHKGNKVIYRYPLIQYKFIDGKISLVGIDEGADSLERHFQYGQILKLTLGNDEMEYQIIDKKTMYYVPESYEDQRNYYFLRGWLPFNQDNYIKYSEIESIAEKIALLDSILSANILSMFNGFGYFSEQKSRANILEIISTRPVKYKDNDMLSFDIRFKCNSNLPELCGLGKGASRGFGVIHTTHQRRKL